MRTSHVSILSVAFLFFLLPTGSARGAAPSRGQTIGVRGLSVRPERFTLSELPRFVPPPAGTPVQFIMEGEPPGGEEAFEELKESQRVPLASQLTHVTIDRSATVPVPRPSINAPIVGTGFEGISQGGFIPSEPTVAAGPLNVFTAGNVTVTVTNKDGSNRTETDGASFFGAPAAEGAISDAVCFFDALRQQFVALCFTQGSGATKFSYFYLAISATNDARGTWYRYKFDQRFDGATQTNNWSDFQGLGVSDDKLAMSSQQFSFGANSYQYQKIRVIDRALAYSGQTVTFVDIFNYAVPPGGDVNDNFVTKVGRNVTAGDNTIHVFNDRFAGGSNVTYRTLTGTPASPVLSAGTRITVNTYAAPPDAPQLGGGTVNTNDCRTKEFCVRNGVLTTSWHFGVNFGGGSVSAVRLFQLRTSDLTVLRDETFGADGVFYYYPSAVADVAGSVYIGFDRSSSTEYSSTWGTGRRPSDASIEASVLLKAGVAATSQTRWGDYTGIDMDESLSGPGGTSAWYAGQWSKASNSFGTWINKLSFTYGQVAGSVFDDCDGSAATTSDRTAVSGATVTLKQGAATLATTTTNASGAYNFGYLETGTYDAVVTPPGGTSAADAVAGSGGNSQTRVSSTDVQVNLTNAQTSSSNTFLVTSTHPSPANASISPNSRTAGSGAFTLTVNGSSFTQCSIVRLDGSNRTTTYVSATQLTAAIPGSDVTTGGTRLITVFTPSPGGGTSGSQTLTVTGGDTSPPSVTVTAPNGGETWRVGTTQTITWNATDDVGIASNGIDLAYSTNGGGSYTNITTGIANTGSFAWTIPNAPTTTARVRVTARDAATNSSTDQSDANFTIGNWIITASAGANGSIAPSGSVSVVDGATPTFTITPSACYHVANVLVDGSSVGSPTSYTFPAVHADHTISATFAINTYTITPSAGAHGTIVPNTATTVNCDGSQSFTITPDACYHIDQLLVDGSSVLAGSSYTFNNVTANHTIAASFAVDAAADPIADLAAAQVKTGNDADGTTKITLTFSTSGGSPLVEVWRKGFGNYPGYDNPPSAGSVPPAPASYPPAGWTLTSVTTSEQTDEPPSRDVWYYVAYVFNACGAPSAVSNRTGGTLNYHLGDVSDGTTPGQGNNVVNGADVSLLGMHYGVSGALLTPYAYLDVGPTTDGTANGRPTTDGVTDFEDLVLFALNYYPRVTAPARALALTTGGVDALSIDAPAHVEAGATISVPVRLAGSGSLQALSAALTWDASVVHPVNAVADDRVLNADALLLTPHAGQIDLALLGRRDVGLAGDGPIATVEFRALATGDPAIGFGRVQGRSADNHDVAIQTFAPGSQATPALTTLRSVRPNPFQRVTTIDYALARSERVSLEVYTVGGRRVRSLASGALPPGSYRVEWDGTDDHGMALRPGVYYLRLQAGRVLQTRTVALVK